jgi:ABC-type transport system involved in cytochrome bd biosynthesis fused ATPase/permease subunit
MSSGGRDPLLRLLGLARPWRGRLLLAVVAGAAATGCGVALLAVSGFLLARASQHPNIVAITAAVVAVRALSVGRGVSRYLERLAAHDAAFRVLPTSGSASTGGWNDWPRRGCPRSPLVTCWPG